ncbi:hypothetical protein LAWASA_1731 [Lawsonibacter asaccharolyticus]|nr:hypothetical protein LAWASA_1731 [Lawsonibacter asaccharolyticus]
MWDKVTGTGGRQKLMQLFLDLTEQKIALQWGKTTGRTAGDCESHGQKSCFLGKRIADAGQDRGDMFFTKGTSAEQMPKQTL